MSDEPQTTGDAGPFGEPGEPGEIIEWQYRVPLLTNRFMLWDFARVITISLVVMYLLVALIGWLVDGEAVLLPWQMLLITGGIMTAAFTLACLLLGNRFAMLFGVGPAGVGYASGSRERKWNRAAVLAGVLGGSSSATGAGLIASSQEEGGWVWADIRRAVEHPRARVITLRNSWRTVLRLYCTPENYEQVRAMVAEGIARGAAERADAAAVAPQKARRPWYSYAAAVLVPILATVLVTAWPWLQYEEGVRVVVLSTVLLIAAGLLHGVPRGVAAILSMLPTGYVIYLTLAEMLTVSDGILPGEVSYGWSYDPGLLALTIVGEMILAGLAVWRLFGHDTAAD